VLRQLSEPLHWFSECLHLLCNTIYNYNFDVFVPKELPWLAKTLAS